MRLDRGERLALLPLDAPEAAELLGPFDETERYESWRLVRRDGSFVSHLGVRGRAADAVYELVVSRRDLLGRLVPDGDAPRRYP